MPVGFTFLFSFPFNKIKLKKEKKKKRTCYICPFEGTVGLGDESPCCLLTVLGACALVHCPFSIPPVDSTAEAGMHCMGKQPTLPPF